MKTSLHVDSLKLTVRGIPAATATGALRGLGPVLARELNQQSATSSAGSTAPAAATRDVSEPALRAMVAKQLAGALRSYTNPNR